jgi:hypothetical protein
MTLFNPRAALLLIGLITAQCAMAHTGLTASSHTAFGAAQQATAPDTTAEADEGLTGVDHYPGVMPGPKPKPKAR